MDFEQYDDDGFLDYAPTSVDPGYSLLIATTLFCLLSNAILPCLVSFGRRYEKRKLASQEIAKTEAPDEIVKEQAQLKDADENRELGDSSKRSEGDQKIYVPESPAKKGGTPKASGGVDSKGNTWRTLIDQVRLICLLERCLTLQSLWINCCR